MWSLGGLTAHSQLYRDLIHPKIKMAGETTPSEAQPDLHIILEFDKGESWGKHTAVRANRYTFRSKFPSIVELGTVRVYCLKLFLGT